MALVTGANRGVGAAYVRALLKRGAAKVYAAMRSTAGYEAPDGRVQPIEIDVTDHGRIARAAAECGDVTLLVNNAGVNHNQPISADAAQQNARDEMDVNFFGTMEMCRQFGPVLGGNGGGAIVNMLSILSRVNLPMIGTYCASKAATLSLTQGVRAELAAQGTLVVAVMPAAIDTRMGNMNPPPLEEPIDVASAALDASKPARKTFFRASSPAVSARALPPTQRRRETVRRIPAGIEPVKPRPLRRVALSRYGSGRSRMARG